MRLSGTVEFAVSAQGLRTALQSPRVLASMIPGTVEMQPAEGGNFAFLMKKTLGPVELRQRGTVEVRLLGDNHVGLELRSRHRLGGTVKVATLLVLIPRVGGTRIDYDGNVEATGLAGRLLRDREERVQPFVRNLMRRLKAEIEAQFAG